MFSFFHRTTTINLDAFTSDSYLYETTPVVPSHKTYPEWWLNIPNGHVRNFDYSKVHSGMSQDEITSMVLRDNNIKNCYGFLEFYKKGAVVESWSDLAIKVGPAGYKYINSNGNAPVEHPSSQYGKGFKNFHHIKLDNPWLFKEKTGTKFLLVGATWALDNYSFVIPPGILDFTLTSIAHVNMFLPKRSEEFILSIGQPLIHLIPLSEKKLKIKNHLVTEQEHFKIRDQVATSHFGWRKKFELMRRNKKREDLKCPFSSEE